MPAVKKHKKDSQTTFRIPAVELAHLKKVAESEGRSVPDLIRRAISKAYPMQKN
ncbi:MAG: ribbon-helix-helix domain-containing protein [Verrucomicrobia bacterium]|nr:ribbon-helix-helix domain-containing protein [Verrucomicrobiota bacterium]